MLRAALRISILLALAATFIAAVPAHAAGDRCGDRLTELGDMEAALEQMEQAVAKGAAQRQALQAEVHELALAIADKQREGAAPAIIDHMQTQRREAQQELTRREALAPKVKGQRDALAVAVDEARRSYIACVDASIEG